LSGTERYELNHIIVGKAGVGDVGLGFKKDDSGKVTLKLLKVAGGYQLLDSVNSVTAGKWHHLVATWDSSGMAVYLDGVLEASNSVASTWDNNTSHYTLIGRQYVSSTDASFDGEMRDVRIHNRALEDTEVAAAYNGEATPWKYADAGAEKITNGTAWTGATGTTAPTGWTMGSTGTLTIDSSSGSGSEPALKITRNSDNPYIWQAFTAEIGKSYRVSYRRKNVDASNITVALGSSNVGNNYHSTSTSSTSWATVEVDITATTTIFSIYVQAVGSSGSAYIDSVSIVPLGEVAAYTPQSINELREITYGGSLAEFDTWCDTTSNGNHGKITGATIVGNNHVYAPLTVKGRSEVGDKNLSSCGSIWLGDHATNRGLIDYDEGTGQGLLRISSYRDADSAKLELATYRTPRLDIDGLGTVRATNSGGSLKQVARVHVNSFTLTTSETFEVITHNLGTSNIVVSVRTDPGNGVGEIVEVAVNTGDENNTESTVTNKCTLRWASAPASDTGYMVTVIG
jgi:hypothetical protein